MVRTRSEGNYASSNDSYIIYPFTFMYDRQFVLILTDYYINACEILIFLNGRKPGVSPVNNNICFTVRLQYLRRHI